MDGQASDAAGPSSSTSLPAPDVIADQAAATVALESARCDRHIPQAARGLVVSALELGGRLPARQHRQTPAP